MRTIIISDDVHVVQERHGDTYRVVLTSGSGGSVDSGWDLGPLYVGPLGPAGNMCLPGLSKQEAEAR